MNAALPDLKLRVSTWLSLLWVVMLLPVTGAEPPPVRVLFVGNSYTYYNDMPLIFGKVCAASGVLKPVANAITDGGLNLADHVRGTKLAAALTNGVDGQPWDVVVLQHQSVLSAMAAVDAAAAAQWQQAARVITGMARQSNPHVLVVLFETWARHPRVWEKHEAEVASMGESSEAMHWRVRGACRGVFDVVNADLQGLGARVLISPVGDFWHQAASELKDIDLYDADGTHPNKTGTWLTAMTILGTIGGREAIEKCDEWAGIAPETARRLKKLLLDHPEIYHDAAKP